MTTSKLTAGQKRIHEAAIRLFSETGSNDINVSELAEYAGVARGTIYNNIKSLDTLFNDVTANLVAEMNRRIVDSFPEDSLPEERLASGIRLYIQRAHTEPVWGKFITRFSYTDEAFQTFWDSSLPLMDLQLGLEGNAYNVREEQLTSIMPFIGGAAIAAMTLVRQGIKTWRDAGSDCAEFVLRGLGLPQEEARELASKELPPLVP